jgi:hypothetical protein
VACWPGIETKLSRQLDDRSFVPALLIFGHSMATLSFLSNRSDDAFQFTIG